MGRDASSFFSHLMTQIYIQHDIDAIFSCEDFNARIGNLPDFDKSLDDKPGNYVLTILKTSTGILLLNFSTTVNFVH